ncbi:MAG: hypothetical protein IPQ08_06265 [Chitinophagaceae bacterium]|nr:hypothetical protein [Chitinophagaceae bacterium]
MKLCLMICSMFIMSCGCIPKKNQPHYSPALYAGSSAIGGIVRKQSNEQMSCLSPKFDDYVAMTYQDLSCVYFTFVQNCVAFKDPKPTCPHVTREEIQKQIDYLHAYLKQVKQ